LMSSQVIGKVEATVSAVLRRARSNPDEFLLVALSGGPDSVAILHALQRLRSQARYRLAAAHLNHGLRGGESDRDESFVRELCGRLDIELVVQRAQELGPPNLEERARELRYGFLNRTADVLDARFIVLGHQRDDQAETVLLRLLRGSGIAGLGAMAEFGPGRLLRPLLAIDRATILAYLTAIGADYVVDRTNLEEGTLRNRLRRSLLPGLERDYSCGIGRRLAELASEMRELEGFIAAESHRNLEPRLIIQQEEGAQPAAFRMNIRGFESVDPALARAMLRELLRRYGGGLRRIERVHIDGMYKMALSKNPSATMALPGSWRFRRDYCWVALERSTAESENRRAAAMNLSMVKLMPGRNQLLSGVTVTLREIAAEDLDFPKAPWHPDSQFEGYFDAAKASILKVRTVRAGDRIAPLGLCGSRKIHDVFVDHKVAVGKRRSWPLVVSGDNVLWIPGLVRSGMALVSPKSKKIVHLRADFHPDQ
jgi:tRNA(Ile)-lysidine synthase